MEPVFGQDPRSHVTPNSRNSLEIGVSEFGIQDGFPVFYFHGLPGSRFEAALWDDAAKSLQLRLIAPDRPGLGLSTHSSSRKLTDYPADIAGLAGYLGLKKYAILAVSGGGIYALACAEAKDKLPGLSAVAVVAGLGPRNLTQKGMGLFQKLAFHAMDWLPAGAVEWLWDAMIGKTARNPDPAVLENALRKSGDWAKGPDSEFYKNDENVKMMAASLRGAFAQGSKGYVHEATIVSQPWGFELEDINLPVRLWYGGKDELAPLSAGRAMARMIPGAQLEGFGSETHSGMVMNHQEDVLMKLVTE